MSAGAAIEADLGIESGQLIAGLTRLARDVGMAEELAQNALVAALEQWVEFERAGRGERKGGG